MKKKRAGGAEVPAPPPSDLLYELPVNRVFVKLVLRQSEEAHRLVTSALPMLQTGSFAHRHALELLLCTAVQSGESMVQEKILPIQREINLQDAMHRAIR